jgi:hypothetical protein
MPNACRQAVGTGGVTDRSEGQAESQNIEHAFRLSRQGSGLRGQRGPGRKLRASTRFVDELAVIRFYVIERFFKPGGQIQGAIKLRGVIKNSARAAQGGD